MCIRDSHSDTLTYADLRKKIDGSKKDESGLLNNFDAAHKLLLRHERERLPFWQRLNLFFIDYDLIPLLVQENYLTASTLRDTVDDLDRIAKGAEVMAGSDLLNRAIRVNGDWGLMPNFGFLSCIMPCDLLGCNMGQFPKFTEFFPKNSSMRKVRRELRELKAATAPRTLSLSSRAVQLDYVDSLLGLILFHLQQEGKTGVANVLEIMEEYGITKQMLDENLVDVQFNPDKVDFFSFATPQTKASLTRLYNSQYKTSIRKRKRKIGDDEGKLIENGEEEERRKDDEEEGEGEGDDDVLAKGAKKKPRAPSKPRGQSKGKKGRKPRADEDEEEDDDDSDDLGDFVVPDSEDEAPRGRRASAPATKRGGSKKK
eukprot:TRINITY_DN1034_c0_g1_i1.p1 TRINITY_DN1034_c0_g1~~TRINITY_DN1034_c0_g1_i1.p1  ORF type:complete len:371 (-),score=113.81 TRINITY_DN1034_c0_g1_i1:22-1134(-)